MPRLPPAQTRELPSRPLIVLEPVQGWVPMNVRELWAHRELLYFLAWRDVRVRYKQALLGVAWALLQPVFAMLTFTVLFGRLGGFDARTGETPYALFAYAGLALWMFFANAVTASSNSLVASANLIGKVYFPRLIVPLAAVAAGVVDLAISLALLAVLLAFFSQAPASSVFLAPIPIFLMVLLASGVGLWTAAVNIRYRDIRHVVPFLIQLGMFVSPIIYPLSLVPATWRPLAMLNPVVGIVESFRACLFGTPLDVVSLAVSAVITVAVFVAAIFWFRRVEHRFVDFV